jgi:hypothetical protein
VFKKKQSKPLKEPDVAGDGDVTGVMNGWSSIAYVNLRFMINLLCKEKSTI